MTDLVAVQVYRDGEPHGFSVTPDAIVIDAEAFTLVFDPESQRYALSEGYSFARVCRRPVSTFFQGPGRGARPGGLA